jgi:cation diffusion facilitator family transporter
MMLIEIVVGYATRSMALLADGWHMATHVGALGLASAAYALSRHYASHRAFGFGTGKVDALAGYTSAVALGLVAVVMIVESIVRLMHPNPIDFVSSLPVAVIGLIVNLVSVRLLHGQQEHGEDDPDEREHPVDHDHNHRAALMHVVADTLTSALAIAALLAGRYLDWHWLDALTGVVGGLVILKWGVGLCRTTGFELLDIDPSLALEDRIRLTLEAVDDVRVSDLHVWSLGRGARSCVVTVVSASPRDAIDYRDRLADFDLAHLTVEVRRCVEGHELPPAARGAAGLA